ncbi:hypothetical protein ACFPYI_00810 [Halomarina salina]|uniref:Uncharacterized protein n=1 Tax=Halomarina salina TaxID=1872699 RepID=A0ABD5RHE1_9EURY|nr:hypothetical protein [Halomarina salina]
MFRFPTEGSVVTDATLRRFVGAFLLWCVASALVLSQFGRVTTALVYATGYVGFLLAAEYSAPMGEPPRWHRHLRWVTILGFVGFLVFVYGWVQQVVPPGTLPTL